MSTDEFRAALDRPQYPRSSNYDPEWVLQGSIGPNVLWATEALCERMTLEPGMRVLDLGCGLATSSIFLAREYGVNVWAVDNGSGPSRNWKRAEEAGVADLVYPFRLDARKLPFARHFFDAVVSISAYMLFGTDAFYMRQLAPLVRVGGQIGIVVMGSVDELPDRPNDLVPMWRLNFECLHSPGWWRSHLERAGLAEVEVADMVPEGWRDWADFYELRIARNDPKDPQDARLLKPEVGMLRADEGRKYGLVRAVARVIK